MSGKRYHWAGSLTKEQKVAMRYHCRLAGECVHPRFASFHPLHSLVLTVNSGYE